MVSTPWVSAVAKNKSKNYEWTEKIKSIPVRWLTLVLFVRALGSSVKMSGYQMLVPHVYMLASCPWKNPSFDLSGVTLSRKSPIANCNEIHGCACVYKGCFVSLNIDDGTCLEVVYMKMMMMMMVGTLPSTNYSQWLYYLGRMNLAHMYEYAIISNEHLSFVITRYTKRTQARIHRICFQLYEILIWSLGFCCLSFNKIVSTHSHAKRIGCSKIDAYFEWFRICSFILFVQNLIHKIKRSKILLN